MEKPVVFDDKASIFHLFLGVVCGINIQWLLSLVIVTIYTLYQYYDEKDTSTEKLGDFVELIVGYLIGDILQQII